MERTLDRQESIRKHVSDMLAVEQHVLEAIERQRETEKVRENVEVNELLIRIERVLKSHVDALNRLSEAYGSEGQSTLKKALTAVFGAAAGIYDKVRVHEVSRMLRDNYTALSLCAMAYTMMHTTGLVIREQRLADVGLDHLKDITPLLVEISKKIPGVTAKEVAEVHPEPVDLSRIGEAVAHTQHAWSHEVTDAA